MRLLVTGGAGFIGSHFVRHVLASYPEYRVTVLDKLTYAGDRAKLEEAYGNPRMTFAEGDIADAALVDTLAREADVMVNFAAETHVDRSIAGPAVFLQTNVMGTQVLLDAARKHRHSRFVQISTDEVYGDVEKGAFTETSLLKPSSPYSASKAAADLLCLAYHRTYGLPVVISRCSNNYGPHQYPEKLVPFFIKKWMSGERAPLYGDGSNVRDWLHVLDHCRAVDLILHRGKVGEVYNVSANEEHSNLEVTRRMLSILGLSVDRIAFVKDRPGHDMRYAMEASKIRKALGWKPEVPFEQGFAETVRWYRAKL